MDRIEQVKALLKKYVAYYEPYEKAGATATDSLMVTWIDQIYSTPSPVAPEPVNLYPDENAEWSAWEDCATAYKAHYDPIVEGLMRANEKLANEVLEMGNRYSLLEGANTSAEMHIDRLEAKVEDLESQLAQKPEDGWELVVKPFLIGYASRLQEKLPPMYDKAAEKLIEQIKAFKSLAPEKEKGK